MIIDTCMLRDELDLLEIRLDTYAGVVDKFVIAEAPVTHRGVAKPMHFLENQDRFAKWAESIIHVRVDELPDAEDPWVREHAQRDAMWPAITQIVTSPRDMVLINDLDEFPSGATLSFPGPGAVSVHMMTSLFAVDWVVPGGPLPTAVACTARWLAMTGGSLARARDMRDQYRVLRDGGWHFSWLGGPDRQLEKLDTATCHVEVLGTDEADLIASGERYRTDKHGKGHLPVTPVEIQEDWPAAIRERRCPPEWFRPREVSSEPAEVAVPQ